MGYMPFAFLTNSMLRLSAIAIYILNAYATYKLASVRGVANPWMAFIPFLNLFMLGMIGDSLKYTNTQIDNLLGNIPLAYALPLISIIASVMGRTLGSIASLILTIGTVMIYYLVFSFYNYKNRILFTILSFIPIVGPVLILYSLRGRNADF